MLVDPDCYIVEDCGICLLEIIPTVNPLDGGCRNGHKFHTACLARLTLFDSVGRCPMCRGDLPQFEELRIVHLAIEKARCLDYLARKKSEGALPDDLFVFVLEEIEMKYIRGSPYWWLMHTPQRQQILGPYPEMDASQFALKFWPLWHHPRHQEQMRDFVKRNHVCSRKCEETPCFFKEYPC